MKRVFTLTLIFSLFFLAGCSDKIDIKLDEKIKENELIEKEDLNTEEEDIKKPITTNDYKYEKNSEDGVTIIDYVGLETDIIIPKKIDGLEVTKIGDKAFEEKGLTSVEIPDTVIEIGWQSFIWNEIETLKLPNSVRKVGKFAFDHNNLKSLKLSNSMTSLTDQSFRNNNLKTIKIPESITYIGWEVFKNNKLTSVIIPESVESIGYGAFARNNLKSVELSDTLKSIDSWAFKYNKLTSVKVPSDCNYEDDTFDDDVKISNK